jgi:hypothetical protein
MVVNVLELSLAALPDPGPEPNWQAQTMLA